MRKILLFVDLFPPRSGGMETHAYELARFLTSQEDLDFKGVVGFSENAADEKLSNREKENTFPVVPIILPESSLYDPAACIEMLEKFEIAAGDIIFFNSLYWIRLYPALREKFPKVIFIQRSGGNDIIQAPIAGKGETLKQRREYVCQTLNETLDLLIVTSEYSVKRLAKAGIHKSLMRAIVGGVDLDRFRKVSYEERVALREKLNLPKDGLIILDVARLVPFKGIEYALQALAQLKKSKQHSQQNWYYVVVGSGPLREALESLAKKLDVSEKVFFANEVIHSKIHAYYQIADIFCHTPIYSRQKVAGGSYIHTESMGRCLCEASATSLPIVVTKVGGVEEIVEREVSGLIVPAQNPKRIAKGIAKLLSNLDIRLKMGQRGREIAATRFSWDYVFEEYRELFKTITHHEH